jgi:hypothetical protein
MASRIEVGSEVVRNRGIQRMRVLGFREIDRGQHAWCEWQDEKGVTRSQQFPVGERWRLIAARLATRGRRAASRILDAAIPLPTGPQDATSA